MMMSKPKSEEANASKPSDTVASLEERIARLGAVNSPPPISQTLTSSTASLEKIASVPPATNVGTSAAKGGGKNALLARIMAAQERAKQAQKAPVDVPPPAFATLPAAPAAPPAFDSSTLPPPDLLDAPPAFESTNSVAPPQYEAPPKDPPPAFFQPPTPSAPPLHDILDASSQNVNAPAVQDMDFLAPPPQMEFSAPPPPIEVFEESQPEEEDFAGLAGMSEEERNAMIEEQKRIMAQIEKNKADNKASEAAARAEAFDMRSSSAAAAVADSDNPIQAMIPGVSGSEDAQCEADRKLAEALQKEEYQAAERSNQNQRRRAQQEAQQRQKSGSSWMSWLGLSSDAPQAPATRAATSTSSIRTPGSILAAGMNVQTGEEPEESITFSSSPRNEREGLLGPARVAEQKPLFSCVADSISTATTSLLFNTQTLQEDREGNVHGVDASSLLAVPQVSREKHN